MCDYAVLPKSQLRWLAYNTLVVRTMKITHEVNDDDGDDNIDDVSDREVC